MFYNTTMGNDLEKLRIEFGKKLQIKRKLMGFRNQTQLADALKIDQATVSSWETGSNMPEPENKEGLKNILKVDESFFDLDYASIDVDSLKKVRETIETLSNRIINLEKNIIHQAPTQSKNQNEFISKITPFLPFLNENNLTWFFDEIRRAAVANGFVETIDKSKNS